MLQPFLVKYNCSGIGSRYPDQFKLVMAADKASAEEKFRNWVQAQVDADPIGGFVMERVLRGNFEVIDTIL